MRLRSLISAFAAVILTVPGLAQDQVQAQEQPQASAQKTPPKGIVKLAKGVWGKLMSQGRGLQKGFAQP